MQLLETLTDLIAWMRTEPATCSWLMATFAAFVFAAASRSVFRRIRELTDGR